MTKDERAALLAEKWQAIEKATAELLSLPDASTSAELDKANDKRNQAIRGWFAAGGGIA